MMEGEGGGGAERGVSSTTASPRLCSFAVYKPKSNPYVEFASTIQNERANDLPVVRSPPRPRLRLGPVQGSREPALDFETRRRDHILDSAPVFLRYVVDVPSPRGGAARH